MHFLDMNCPGFDSKWEIDWFCVTEMETIHLRNATQDNCIFLNSAFSSILVGRYFLKIVTYITKYITTYNPIFSGKNGGQTFLIWLLYKRLKTWAIIVQNLIRTF